MCTAVGTPLGEKTVEIAHKVATDTAEELRQMAANYEDQTLPGTSLTPSHHHMLSLECMHTLASSHPPTPHPLSRSDLVA